MRLQKSFAFSGPLMLTAGASLLLGGAGQVSAQNTSPAVRQFILNQPYLPILPAGSRSSQPTLHDANGNQISDTVVNETLSVVELSALNPNAGVLWPGSIVQGRGLTTGTLSAINVARAPGNLVLSPLGSTVRGQRRTAVVNAPGAASVEDARSRLLQSGFFVPQNVGYEFHQFYSLDDALLQIGAQANYLSAEVRGQLESSSYEHKTNMMMVFTQPYYTLAMEAPASPTSYFAPSVTVNDLTPYASDDARPSRINPTMYVASVTYGRMGMLIFSSDQSYDSLKASVQGSFSAVVYGGSISMNAQQSRLAQQTDIKLLMLGGDANSGTRLVTTPAQALQAMNTWMARPLAPRDVQTGVPISYRVNYLKDNSLATLSFSTQFTREQVSQIPRYTDWKIEFNTTDDDKDGDTQMRVEVLGPAGNTIADYQGSGGQNGAQYTYKNGSRNTLNLNEDGLLYVRDAGGLKFHVHIDPNGHDSWNFNFRLTARNTAGGGPVTLKSGSMNLSQHTRDDTK